MLLSNTDSVLLIIDVQTSLLTVINNSSSTLKNIQTLIAVKETLDIPILITEQYPKGLGRTLPSILDIVKEQEVFTKTHFSLVREPHIVEALRLINRRQIVIAGMESHVCVLQSALELQRLDYDVFVVSDAISSRKKTDHEAAIQRLMKNNIDVVTTEMVAFEWLEKACTKEFRALLPLLK